MQPHISDRCPLLIRVECPVVKGVFQFKFLNYLVDTEGFMELIAQDWQRPLAGDPLYILWWKLRRLQPIIMKVHRKHTKIEEKITKAYVDLEKIQELLRYNKFDHRVAELESEKRNELRKWREVKEKYLVQKA